MIGHIGKTNCFLIYKTPGTQGEVKKKGIKTTWSTEIHGVTSRKTNLAVHGTAPLLRFWWSRLRISTRRHVLWFSSFLLG